MTQAGRSYTEQYEEAVACKSKEEAKRWLEAELQTVQAQTGVSKEQALRNICISFLFRSKEDLVTRNHVHTLFHDLFVGVDVH